MTDQEEAIRARAAARKKLVASNQVDRMSKIMNTSPENTHMPEEYYRSLNNNNNEETKLKINPELLQAITVKKSKVIYYIQDALALLSLIIGNMGCTFRYVKTFRGSERMSNAIYFLHNQYTRFFFICEVFFGILGLTTCGLHKLLHFQQWVKHFLVRIGMLVFSHIIYTNLCL